MGEFAVAEIGARKIQMIHDKWKHRLPRLSANTDAGDDDTHLLTGTFETQGNLGMAPSLRKWLGDELAKESMAAKERRKAHEERAMAVKSK